MNVLHNFLFSTLDLLSLSLSPNELDKQIIHVATCYSALFSNFVNRKINEVPVILFTDIKLQHILRY